MRNERVEFTGGSGRRLGARLSLPPGDDITACAIFAHCFTCSKDLKPVVNISRALTQRRIAVLRFDFTGLGESEGDFGETTFSSDIDDLVAAAEYMAAELEPPAILVGHSLGGAAVLHAAHRIDSINAVATIGAPFDASHVKHLFANDLERIEGEGEAVVTIGGRSVRVSREFVRDLSTHSSETTIAELRTPLLIFHSPLDDIVGIENAALIYEAARHPKSFVSLDDADHLLLRERDSLYVGDVLAAWAARYIDAPEAPRTREELRGDQRVAARTGAGGFATEILAGRHSLLADEPVAVGGSDLGPSPYELLAAALGACTTMTLRMYAARKNWPLEEAVARLRHSKIHAEDEERCEEQDARMDRLDRELTLTGPLTDDQRRRLLDIAQKCPVHRTLAAGVRVETRLAGDVLDAAVGADGE